MTKKQKYEGERLPVSLIGEKNLKIIETIIKDIERYHAHIVENKEKEIIRRITDRTH